VISRTGNGLKA